MTINIVYFSNKIERKVMFENEEFWMFVVVPALLLPVGWLVTKILKTYEN